MDVFIRWVEKPLSHVVSSARSDTPGSGLGVMCENNRLELEDRCWNTRIWICLTSFLQPKWSRAGLTSSFLPKKQTPKRWVEKCKWVYWDSPNMITLSTIPQVRLIYKEIKLHNMILLSSNMILNHCDYCSYLIYYLYLYLIHCFNSIYGQKREKKLRIEFYLTSCSSVQQQTSGELIKLWL